jgi:hypothetical protein
LEIVGAALAASFAVLYALSALWVYGRGIADEIRINEPDRGTVLLTEEEMQRQQLLRLLQEKKSKKKTSSKVIQKTFHVKVPEHIDPGRGYNAFMPPARDDDYYR